MTSMQEFSLLAQTWEYVVGLVGLLLFVPLWRAINPRRRSGETAESK